MSVLTTAAETIQRIPGRFVTGTTIWDVGEWDICAILDGCRVDTFRDLQQCDEYTSVGATSPEWLRKTFADPPEGTAYVTGNPYLSAVDTDELAYVHQEAVREVDGIETVPPSVLADHAAALWDRRDEFGVDRIVVHFMQPHVPFHSRPQWFEAFSGTETWGSTRWKALANGRVSRKAWFDSYRDNLYWGLKDGVHRMAEYVDATIGVTADHGNAAGEWGVYGHPKGVAVPSVRRVPWHVVEGEQKRDAPAVDLNGQTLTDDAEEQQLRALGYL